MNNHLKIDKYKINNQIYLNKCENQGQEVEPPPGTPGTMQQTQALSRDQTLKHAQHGETHEWRTACESVTILSALHLYDTQQTQQNNVTYSIINY